MKKLILILALGAFACVFTGCSSMEKRFDYTVTIVNKGKDMLQVDPFQICDDGQYGIVNVGGAYPGLGKGFGILREKPYQNLTLSWHYSTNGVTIQKQVPLNLPKEFTMDRAMGIWFTFYEENQSVDVAYEVITGPNIMDTKMIEQAPVTPK